MLTRSQSKQSIGNTTVTRSTRTIYFLRNLPIINYFESDDEEVFNEESNTEINFSYNNDNMPGPYDDIGPYCHSEYCDYCGSGYYSGYDGYDN
uniref:Uncharacterized protein n=1 Tax=viral metagenome TaxID=1070528 RepID=A0A6C0ASF9_9ZZZZ